MNTNTVINENCKLLNSDDSGTNDCLTGFEDQVTDHPEFYEIEDVYKDTSNFLEEAKKAVEYHMMLMRQVENINNQDCMHILDPENFYFDYQDSRKYIFSLLVEVKSDFDLFDAMIEERFKKIIACGLEKQNQHIEFYRQVKNLKGSSDDSFHKALLEYDYKLANLK